MTTEDQIKKRIRLTEAAIEQKTSQTEVGSNLCIALSNLYIALALLESKK